MCGVAQLILLGKDFVLFKPCTIAVCLIGMSAALNAQYLFLSTSPTGAGVSTGANTATFTVVGGSAGFYLGPDTGTEVLGSFSGIGPINYTSASTAFPITVTLPSGTLTGTITFLQNSFEDTGGGDVDVYKRQGRWLAWSRSYRIRRSE